MTPLLWLLKRIAMPRPRPRPVSEPAPRLSPAALMPEAVAMGRWPPYGQRRTIGGFAPYRKTRRLGLVPGPRLYADSHRGGACDAFFKWLSGVTLRRMNLPGGWELIFALILMLALIGWVIWRVGPRR